MANRNALISPLAALFANVPKQPRAQSWNAFGPLLGGKPINFDELAHRVPGQGEMKPVIIRCAPSNQELLPGLQ
jgi:hypothetical protein